MTPLDPRAAASAGPSELRLAIGLLRPRILKASGFSVVAGLLGLVSTWYMLEVYDRVVNSRSMVTLAMLTVMAFIAYAMMEILEWAHHEEMSNAGLELDARVGDRIFAASFEANLRRLPGGTYQSLNDLRVLRDFLPGPILKSVADLPVALVFLALVFVVNPWLGVAALVGALLQFVVTMANERSTQPPLSAANRESIGAQQYADGSLRNAQVIEAMGMLADIHRRWLGKQRQFLKLQAVASESAGTYSALSKFLQTLMSSLLMGLAAMLLLRNELNGGAAMLIIASILGARALQPLVTIVTQWRTAVLARDAYKRLDTLLAAVPAKPRGMVLPAPSGRLVAENLYVPPPGSQTPILKGLNFQLDAGEVLAVIGPSASGKTTLARVLTGVWPSVGGKARLDGADIHTWEKSMLGPHVGYLPQGVELFDGTVAENIARFGEVDMAKVEAAARAVGLREFIEALPDGYETELGPEGARLSGGQRQRVGLARALYGNPVFVVLDEPNSSLDEAGDAALNDAIVQAKARGTTFIVITHRTTLLKVADKILLLRDGVQQAFGPRDDVLAALAKATQEAAARTHAALAARAAPQPAAPEVAA